MGCMTLVTGGTDGIGKAIVKELLRRSDCPEDRVYVNYGHSDDKANALIASLPESERVKVELLKADMGTAEGLADLVAAFDKKGLRFDRVILNVGISGYGAFEDYDFEMWDRVIRTNLTIPVFLLKELKTRMNENGSIVLMGSYAGKKEYSSSLVYSVSKAGVLFLAKALVKEFEGRGVRINAIAPGFIETQWQSNRSEESYDRINRKIALHRFGTPAEVADISVAVLENTYMNGAIIDIHGGYEYF